MVSRLLRDSFCADSLVWVAVVVVLLFEMFEAGPYWQNDKNKATRLMLNVCLKGIFCVVTWWVNCC